jgi:hypothetical protein
MLGLSIVYYFLRRFGWGSSLLRPVFSRVAALIFAINSAGMLFVFLSTKWNVSPLRSSSSSDHFAHVSSCFAFCCQLNTSTCLGSVQDAQNLRSSKLLLEVDVVGPNHTPHCWPSLSRCVKPAKLTLLFLLSQLKQPQSAAWAVYRIRPNSPKQSAFPRGGRRRPCRQLRLLDQTRSLGPCSRRSHSRCRSPPQPQLACACPWPW